jgi:hypothetical protein
VERKIAASHAIWGIIDGLAVVLYVLPRTTDWEMRLCGIESATVFFWTRPSISNRSKNDQSAGN